MKVAENKTIRGALALMKFKGYKVNERPYELNILGVRKNSTIPNKFDDKLYAFWKNDKGKWEGKYYNITTDPGTYWLNNPMNPQGTAIIKEGQYIDSHELGLHRGQYKALVQKNPVRVIRDYDRNAVLDFYNGKEEKGLFGINIHRANAKGTTKSIDKYSAGCQVFENADDFENFLGLAEKHKDLYGNKFTYTIVDERALNRSVRRRFIYLLVGAGIVASAYFVYKKKLIFKK